MKKHLLFAAFVVLSIHVAYGQTIKYYGYDSTHSYHPSDIIETKDGNFVITSSVNLAGSFFHNFISSKYLLKINSQGDTMWSSSHYHNMYHNDQLMHKSDGNLMSFGTSGNTYNCGFMWALLPFPKYGLYTYNSIGDTLSYQIGENGCENQLSDISTTKDGSIIALNRVSGLTIGASYPTYILNVSKSGHINNTFIEKASYFSHIQEASSGYWLLSWNKLRKVSSAGDSLWQKDLSLHPVPRDFLTVGGDSLLIACSSTDAAYGDSTRLIKMDDSGQIDWNKKFHLRTASVMLHSSGNYILTGRYNGKARVIAVSPKGDSLWSRTTTLASSASPVKTIETDNGKIMTLSGSGSFGMHSNIAVITDSSGVLPQGISTNSTASNDSIWIQVEDIQGSQDFLTKRGAFARSIAIDSSHVIAGNAYTSWNGSAFVGIGEAYVMSYDSSAIKELDTLKASDPQEGGQFGSGVAISGNYAIVGAAASDNFGAAYFFEKNSTGDWVQKQKVTPSLFTLKSFFGYAVDIQGNYAVVGANRDSLFSTSGDIVRYAGSAYVYERDGSGVWQEVARLTASDFDTNDRFGISVALSGNQILVGAYNDGGSSAFSANYFEPAPSDGEGAVYVFERSSSGIWTQKQKLIASDPVARDAFGWRVAADQDRAVISAVGKDYVSALVSGPEGAAYIFKRNSSTGLWTEEQKIQASGLIFIDHFAYSVDISGDRVMAGTPYEDYIAPYDVPMGQGAVYSFHLDSSGVWTEEQKIVPLQRNYSDLFGNSVAVYKNTLIVGSNNYQASMADTSNIVAYGNLYLFERDSISPSSLITIWNGSAWDNGTPHAALDAVIAGNYSGPAFTTNHLTVNPGVSFYTYGGDAHVKGNVMDSSLPSGSFGRLVLSGSTPQTLQGAFHSVKISNASGVTLSGPTAISNLLTLEAGTLTTNNNLTLSSSAANQCACLAPVNYNGAINGDITTERQLPAGTDRYFYAGTPLKSQTIADWQNDMSMSSMYTFSPTVSANNGWVAANSSTNIVPGIGTIFFGSSSKIDNTGSPVIGDGTDANSPFIFNVSRSETSGYVSNGVRGFNLLANPYPCAISWADMSKTDVTQTYWLWDGTGYQFYMADGTKGGNNSGSDVNNNIASGQAFFVLASTSGPGQMSVSEDDKVTFGSSSFLNTQTSDRLGMTLHQLDNNNLPVYSDRSFIKMSQTASNSFSYDEDVAKLDNDNVNLSSFVQAGTRLAINALPFAQQSVKLSVTGGTGNYSLNFDGVGSFAAGSQFFLQDKHLNTITDLTTQPNYAFSITANAASQGDDRFEIVTVVSSVTGLNSGIANKTDVSVYPNPASGWFEVSGAKTGSEFSLVSATGKVVKSGQISQNMQRVETEGLSKGVYILQVRTQDGVATQKVVIK